MLSAPSKLVLPLTFLLLIPGCNEDSPATNDGGMSPGDSSTPDDGVDPNATPGTIVVTVNGEGPITLTQSNLVINNFPNVPVDAIYTSFGAQLPSFAETVLITFPGQTTGTFTGQMARVQYSRLSPIASGDTSQANGSCTVVVTEFGGPGGVIRGTFEAHTENTTGTFDLTNGSFAINRP